MAIGPSVSVVSLVVMFRGPGQENPDECTVGFTGRDDDRPRPGIGSSRQSRRLRRRAPPEVPGPKPARPTPRRRRAWGDPDLQGTYTNKDESGIPFERPSEFEGKKIDDVADAELAELVKERAAAAAQRAAGIGGADTGAGPTHWYENYDAKNSRPWLVVDPADGRIPPLTPDAQARIAAMPPARSSFTNGPWESPADCSLYDRCITRGIPGSMMPAIYGNSYQIVRPRATSRSATR